jgi:hypothetical protein
MFGHQDDQDQHHHHDDDQKPMEDVLTEPAVDSVLSTEHHGGTVVSDDDGFNPALPSSDDSPFGTLPTQDNTPPTNAPTDDVSVPTVPDDQPVAEPVDDLVAPTDNANGDLLSIKQQVLTDLSPLVGHLDQTPEEKFRTTMMMIQASDNQALIQTAYQAAQAITDEKVKAQALLDIVNEINYFTQQHAA